MITDYSRELECARVVVRQAATRVANFDPSALGVTSKSGGEPVTAADLASSELIVRALSQAFPDDAILSEELPDDSSRLHKQRVWMIDPIDGTRDFIAGAAGYVVMFGLCVAGRPVVGIVAQPKTGFVWMGATGLGATKESPQGERTPLRVSRVSDTRDIRLVSSKSHRSEYYARFCATLGIRDEMALGSVGLKVALVAEGVRDLYVYPGSQTKIWDSCGPEAILTAAGGTVTDSDGKPLRYTDSMLKNPRGMVASNGLVHDRAIATIAELRQDASPHDSPPSSLRRRL